MKHHPRIRNHRQRREDKGITLARHTKVRMFQRFEMEIGDDGLLQLTQMCRTNKYLCHLEKQSNSRSLFAVEFRNRVIPVVYDRNRHCIVTALADSMLSNTERSMIDSMYLKLHKKPYVWSIEKRQGETWSA